MKKIIGYVFAFLFLCCGIFYLWLNHRTHIPDAAFTGIITPAKNIKKTKLQFSVINTAYMETPAGMASDGLSWFKKTKLYHRVIVVQHPKGTFIYDTGLGNNIASQAEKLPWYTQLAMKYTFIHSAFSQISQDPKTSSAIKNIYLSHVHWDHTSGLIDFPNATVHVPESEQQWFNSAGTKVSSGIFANVFSHPQLLWQIIPFNKEPYEGYENSYDLYGDGSVVFVLMSGHTPGSIGMFLNLDTKRRYFFIGDTTWTLNAQGYANYKSKLARLLSDHDIAATAMQIKHINQLKTNEPNITILPVHDEHAYDNLKFWPEWNL